MSLVYATETLSKQEYIEKTTSTLIDSCSNEHIAPTVEKGSKHIRLLEENNKAFRDAELIELRALERGKDYKVIQGYNKTYLIITCRHTKKVSIEPVRVTLRYADDNVYFH